jgi:hypothetical protein
MFAVALRAGNFFGAGCFGKAAAEPPHSKTGWAFLPKRTLHEGEFCGQRALRLGARFARSANVLLVVRCRFPPRKPAVRLILHSL